MKKRALIAAGMVLGAVWAVVLVIGAWVATEGFWIPLNVALIVAFTPAGVVLAAMIGVISARRFFDISIIDGDAFAPDSRADIDARVLRNTIEQVVLALALWPVIALVLGSLVVVAIGVSFGVARLLFWVGYHMAPPLRALGFAASFYPTVAGAIWSGLVWVV